jgi:hypothetical protein
MARRIDLMVKHRGLKSAEEWVDFCVWVRGASGLRKAPWIVIFLYRTLRPLAPLAP